MLFNIISVSNKLSKWESDGIDAYKKQLPKYVSLKFENIKGQQHPKRSISEIKSLESKLISSRLKEDSFNIAFDIKGKELDSIQFSHLIKECFEKNKITNFLIGGSFGLSKEIINSSDVAISISKMTFPHRLFKILLVEQIYRSFSIINNSPYHK